MEPEQIAKRLEWLDNERRKDKSTIASLENRLRELEGLLTQQTDQLKETRSEVTLLSTANSRFDQLNASLGKIQVELGRKIETIEKLRADHEREMDKVRRDDLESLNKSILELRKATEATAELKKTLQARVEEEFRLGRIIEELKSDFEEKGRIDEEQRRSHRLLDEGRRQDSKRLTDLQGEVAAIRKRLDEVRGKTDLSTESVHKLELRIGDLIAAEAERRQSQTTFMEKQNLQMLERERAWKEWQARFEEFSRQSTNLDVQLQALDAAGRATKRSQEAFEEITQRFERRINELTEMQRLVEERFRQEWVTFKADDQKRWTNYTLTHEEQYREIERRFEKFNERLILLEDLTQELRDLFYQTSEYNQNHMQALLVLFQEWAEDQERSRPVSMKEE